MHRVRRAAHHVPRHVIGDDPVAAFAGEFGLGVRDDILRFGGETDEQAGALWAAREACQNIGVFDEGERWHDAAAVFLDLLCGTFDAPIGDGGDHDCGVGGERGFDGSGHFAGGLHVEAGDAFGGWQRNGSGDQGDVCAAFGERGGDGETLFSG